MSKIFVSKQALNDVKQADKKAYEAFRRWVAEADTNTLYRAKKNREDKLDSPYVDERYSNKLLDYLIVINKEIQNRTSET